MTVSRDYVRAPGSNTAVGRAVGGRCEAQYQHAGLDGHDADRFEARITHRRAGPAPHPIVVEAAIVAPDGRQFGEVLVFAHNGCLSWLEVCSWTDAAAITSLPPPDQLEPYG